MGHYSIQEASRDPDLYYSAPLGRLLSKENEAPVRVLDSRDVFA